MYSITLPPGPHWASALLLPHSPPSHSSGCADTIAIDILPALKREAFSSNFRNSVGEMRNFMVVNPVPRVLSTPSVYSSEAEFRGSTAGCALECAVNAHEAPTSEIHTHGKINQARQSPVAERGH
jgi:hypothetical protein